MSSAPLDRIVFGTARLAGGAYARASARLLETCLRAGITRFDTAPSYGMGASEALLGAVTAGDRSVEIATKLGSQRPSHPALRGWAKRLYRLSGLRQPPAPPAYADFRRHTGPGPAMDHRPEACARSFERSLALLRRDRIDLLFLHEAAPEEVPAATLEQIGQWQAEGRIGGGGAAHQGPVATLPSGWTAQIAPDLADFAPTAPAPFPVRFHSVRTFARAAAGADPALAERLERVAARIGGGDPQGLAPFALLAALQPQARLLYATSDADRLTAFLAAWQDIALPDIAKALA